MIDCSKSSKLQEGSESLTLELQFENLGRRDRPWQNWDAHSLVLDEEQG